MSTGAGATHKVTPSSHESSTQHVAKRARGTRVPRSDATPEEVAAFATKWGIDTRDADWPEFLDFWRGAAGKFATKDDWAATWRNRKRKVASQQGELRRFGPAVQPAPATGRVWKVGQ